VRWTQLSRFIDKTHPRIKTVDESNNVHYRPFPLCSSSFGSHAPKRCQRGGGAETPFYSFGVGVVLYFKFLVRCPGCIPTVV
jgi:hypothetical protein